MGKTDTYQPAARYVIGLLILIVLSACERPMSPSFETEQRYTIPLINNTEYRLLGGSGSIIDTTRSGFRDRFNVDAETGLAILGFESQMPFGAFNDVLSGFELEPTGGTISPAGSMMPLSNQLTLNGSFSTKISLSSFEFSSPEDFVEIGSATLVFSDIENQTGLEIEQLQLSFPTIYGLDVSGNIIPSDTLVITRSGSQIAGGSFTSTIRDVRIFAEGNEIPVLVSIRFESDESGPPQGGFGIMMSSEPFQPVSARGIIMPKVIALGNDGSTSDNGPIDVIDPNRYFESEFNDLDFLSARFEGITLTNSSLELDYTTNLGIGTMVYALVMGRNDKGEEFFLSGIPGSPYYVSPSDTVDGFLYRGEVVPQETLLRFPTFPDGDEIKINDTHTFTNENSNVNEFLSQFPTEIFLVNKVLSNPDMEPGFAEVPVDFDVFWRVNIPFSLATEDQPATFDDLIEVSLSRLPDRRDEAYISDAQFTLVYQNRLPLDVDIRLTFLDENEDSVTILPFEPSERIRMLSAPVGPAGFSSDVRTETIQFSLNEEQLEVLNRSEFISLDGELITSDFRPVNLRGSDFLNVDLRSNFTVRLVVD
ncbi:MAG: hypothetical protein LAT84_07400 [Balneolia bacterium]|nr:hypothetical protein [Balneolia bacterium]